MGVSEHETQHKSININSETHVLMLYVVCQRLRSLSPHDVCEHFSRLLTLLVFGFSWNLDQTNTEGFSDVDLEIPRPNSETCLL